MRWDRARRDHGAGLFGFGSALVVGPCVTPPLATALLYVAQPGDVVRGADALFALRLGMGLPLIVFGTFGRGLPRSEKWLLKVKQAFALVFGGRLRESIKKGRCRGPRSKYSQMLVVAPRRRVGPNAVISTPPTATAPESASTESGTESASTESATERASTESRATTHGKAAATHAKTTHTTAEAAHMAAAEAATHMATAEAAAAMATTAPAAVTSASAAASAY
jgi:hypothetical protein